MWTGTIRSFTQKVHSLTPKSTISSLWNISAKTIDGVEVNLGELCKDKKAILVVNVASDCERAEENYTELVEMHEEYSEKGFEILAFPCNQFNKLEPGTNAEIKASVQEKYGAKFPLFEKIDVNFEDAHDVYAYLRTNSSLWSKK